MEVLKIITRANGGDDYIDNAVDYIFDGRCDKIQGYGISSNDADSAKLQFKKIAEFDGNQDKNPFIHTMLSYTPETAPTTDVAMALTDKILEPYIEDHAALTGSHNKETEGSKCHTHTCISTTNINGGKMMCPDNKTTYAMAQRVADVTGQPTKLVVENVKKVEWECPKTFYPQNEEDED